jgi:Tfp pilus assembly protein PilP
MKKLGFVAMGVAALALAACGKNNADQLNESEAQNVEASALNDLAANAANAEMEALGNQQQQLEAENSATTVENTDATSNDALKTDPSKVEDDVQGM